MYTDEPDFRISNASGEVNPLSKGSQKGALNGFSFSVFRHYGSSTTRVGDVITLVIPTNPKTNPLQTTGWGHDWMVSETKPIVSQRSNWQTELATIQTWSPYSKSLKLDFLNGKRYNELLHTSSIWSK